MEKTRPILYGVADYAEMRKANAWFVDRTAKIRALEATRYAMFLRPRRFGKSLIISMLHAYYDVKFADRFAQVDCGKDATIAVRCRLGSPTSAKELVTGTDVPTKGDTFDYTVPAGDLAVFSLDLPTLKQ